MIAGLTRNESSWLWAIFSAMVVMAATIALYAFGQAGNRVAIFSTSAIIALAALAGGVVLGFIFGIPKTVPSEQGARLLGGESFRRNTNLEQVSDWLVKVLIGAGVTWLATVGTAYVNVGRRLPQHLGSAAELVFPAIVLFFSVSGFLAGYLWTGLHLPRQLNEAVSDADPEFYLSTMNAYLYARPPTGFTRVIEIGERNQAALAGDPRYWRYLACAYGQRYAWAKEIDAAGAEVLVPLRQRTLDSLKKAAKMDESAVPRLERLWRPPDGSVENDLCAFRDDPDFEALFHPSAVTH